MKNEVTNNEESVMDPHQQVDSKDDPLEHLELPRKTKWQYDAEMVVNGPIQDCTGGTVKGLYKCYKCLIVIRGGASLLSHFKLKHPEMQAGIKDMEKFRIHVDPLIGRISYPLTHTDKVQRKEKSSGDLNLNPKPVQNGTRSKRERRNKIGRRLNHEEALEKGKQVKLKLLKEKFDCLKKRDYFQCKQCQKVIKGLQGAFNHYEHIHVNAGWEYKCPKCLSIKANPKYLSGHLRRDHGMAFKIEDMEAYKVEKLKT